MIRIEQQGARASKLWLGPLMLGLAACSSSPVVSPGDASPDVAAATDAQDAAGDLGGGSDIGAGPDVVDAGSPADVVDAGSPADVVDAATPTDSGPPAQNLSSRAIVECGMVCTRPLDAVLTANGSVVFFTAFTSTREPAVFRATVPAPGAQPATPTVVTMGGSLRYPIGLAISNDDNTLYIADQTADRGTDEGVGVVFSLAAGGGMPSALTLGTDLVHPVAVTTSFDGNELFISAQRRDDMGTARALFRVARAGGTPTVVTTDLVDPSGISQGAAGNIIVHDTRRGGARSATAVTVGAMSNTALAGNLVANYPAGLALAMDSRSALFSGADPESAGLLTFSANDGRVSAPASLSMGMETPRGIHRARMSDNYAVADESAGASGRIFLVSITP